MTHLLKLETLKWILVSGVHKIFIRRGAPLLRIELQQADQEDTDMMEVMILKIIRTIQVKNILVILIKCKNRANHPSNVIFDMFFLSLPFSLT